MSGPVPFRVDSGPVVPAAAGYTRCPQCGQAIRNSRWRSHPCHSMEGGQSSHGQCRPAEQPAEYNTIRLTDGLVDEHQSDHGSSQAWGPVGDGATPTAAEKHARRMKALLAALRTSVSEGRTPVSLRTLQYVRHAIETPLHARSLATLLREEHKVRSPEATCQWLCFSVCVAMPARRIRADSPGRSRSVTWPMSTGCVPRCHWCSPCLACVLSPPLTSWLHVAGPHEEGSSDEAASHPPALGRKRGDAHGGHQSTRHSPERGRFYHALAGTCVSRCVLSLSCLDTARLLTPAGR